MVASKPSGQVTESGPGHGRQVVEDAARPEVNAAPDANLPHVNDKLAASGLRVAVVPIGQCELLERNARFMRVEQYRRLVENIRRDGCLTSVPFAVRRPGATAAEDRYVILSGNHRVKAAQDAGLTEVMVLYTDRGLTRAQQVAIQLSHNAVVGQDDLAILRELYDEVNDVALKEYSGLDDLVLGQLNPPTLEPLSEKGLEYRIVSIAFLPEEVERAEKVFAKVLEQAMGDVTWVNRFADYDRVLDALTAAKASAGVKNTATAFGLLLDLAGKDLKAARS